MKVYGVKMYFGNLEIFKKHIQILKEEGYNGIYFNSDFFLIEDKDTVKEVSKILKDNSFIVIGGHNVEVYPELNGKIEDIIFQQEKVFENAKILGVDKLTIHFGACKGIKREEKYNFQKVLKKYNLSLSEYKERNIKVLKLLCKRAKKYSLTYTIENTPTNFICSITRKVDDILEIIEKVGEENLGICFDTGHAFVSNLNLYEEIVKCKNKPFEVHLHDNFGKISKDTEINDFHQPCGIGKIDWLEVIKGFDEINFKGPYTFEIRFGNELRNLLKINKLNWERFLNLYQRFFKN